MDNDFKKMFKILNDKITNLENLLHVAQCMTTCNSCTTSTVLSKTVEHELKIKELQKELHQQKIKRLGKYPPMWKK